MKIIVPIKGFIIDESFTFNNIYFISMHEVPDTLSNLRKKYVEPIKPNQTQSYSTTDLIPNLTGFDLSWFESTTLAIIKVEQLEYDAYLSNDDRKRFISYYMDKVNQTLDFFRVFQCTVSEQTSLPGIPSIMEDGYSVILLVNPQNEYIPLIDRLYNLSIVDGLGLYMDSDYQTISKYKSDILYSALFGESESYTNLVSKNAIRRLNEAMYIPDINSRFIYLMTTLEILSHPEYIHFSKVKQVILALTCSSKNNFHEQSKLMTDISQNYRTEVVHNGKSLLYLLPQGYNKLLNSLQGLIVRTVYAIVESGANSFEELEAYIEKRKIELEIKENPKIDASELINDIMAYYVPFNEITFTKDEFIEILESLKQPYLVEYHKKVHPGALKRD